MGYARHVGRIGALAVALGAGVAIAAAPAVGYAQPADSSAAPSAGDSSASAASAATNSSSPNSGAASHEDTDGISSPGGTVSGSATGSALPGADDAPTSVVSSSGGAHTATGAGGDDPAADSDPGLKDEPAGEAAGQPDGTNSVETITARDDRQATAVSTHGPSHASGVAGAARGQHETLAGEDLPSEPARLQPVTGEPAGAAVTSPPIIQPLVNAATVSLPAAAVADASSAPATVTPMGAATSMTDFASGVVGTLVTAASQLLVAALGMAAPDTGPLPNESPLVWTMLAFARREIETTLLSAGPAATAASAVMSPNLLVNPGAETANPSLSGYISTVVPGWIPTGTPTVIKYGTVRVLQWPVIPGNLPGFLNFPATAPAGGGNQFFGGGPVDTSTLSQTVDLGAAQSQINTGTVPYALSAQLGGFVLDPSAASVKVTFLDANKGYLGAGALGPVTVLDRFFQTGFQQREASGTIPVGTRYAQVTVTFTDCNPVPGHYNNAYADNLSFTVGASGLAPATLTPPTSTVGHLDHLFMTYMENKGAGDILGSPNAPYINSLVNAYGYGSNYYGVGHPSNPNYYPIIGASDFGITGGSVDAPNLMDQIEATPGMNWASYKENDGDAPDESPYDRDPTPFLSFDNIANNPERVAKHLFALPQMATDLAAWEADPEANPFPNYVWFEPNEANNMEGPTDFPFGGAIPWLLSFLTDHQYNVAAGDKFLQNTVPTILNSALWKDPNQKSAIFITWDEDFDNISLGVGNQGNKIPMIVIPSPGAVAAGMRSGHFVVADYNNHYSLTRTIEETLGLTPINDNDTYAQPMNGYWK